MYPNPIERPPPASDLPALDLANLGFLVVDRNKHMRILIRQVLKSLGAGSIHEARNGSRGFKAVRLAHPDIVLTGLDMSPVNGLELARALRTSTDSPNPYVPIIMITGHSAPRNVHQARDAGVDEFLAKPVAVRSLYARIVAVILRRRTFVRTDNYFGPDRHRRDDAFYKGPRRRREDLGITFNTD